MCIWRGTWNILWLSGPYFTWLDFHPQNYSYISIEFMSNFKRGRYFLLHHYGLSRGEKGSLSLVLMSTTFLLIKRTKRPVVYISIDRCAVLGFYFTLLCLSFFVGTYSILIAILWVGSAPRQRWEYLVQLYHHILSTTYLSVGLFEV